MIKIIIYLLIIYLIYRQLKTMTNNVNIENFNKLNIQQYKNTNTNTNENKNEIKNTNTNENKNKPYLWQYWDNIDNNKTYAYINLCFNSVDKHCSTSFNIIRLNKDTILDYLPELKTLSIYNKLDNLIIAHKVDLYRIMLLKKYGGLYMDADIIVLRDPIEVTNKLYDYDFVGFGCTGNVCNNGYGEPSNWILASRQNGILITRVLNNIINKISNHDTFDYHDLGKLVIWDELNILIKNGYKYYHYFNKVDGSRDKYGLWIHSDIAFSNQKIIYEDEDNMMFFVVYNSGISKNIKELSEEEILNKDWNFTKFIKKSIF